LHTTAHRAGAFSTRRDVKKALQQLGRTRADILLLLPKPLLIKLAATELPIGPAGHLDRKVDAAIRRLKKGLAAAASSSSSGTAAAAEEDSEQEGEEEGEEEGQEAGAAAAAAAAAEVPVALGKASTQDVLRLLWCIADDGPDVESGGEQQFTRSCPNRWVVACCVFVIGYECAVAAVVHR
jgi:hypothetical protein